MTGKASSPAMAAAGGGGAILGTLRGSGVELQLTEHDALWAGRMLYGEEGAAASYEAHRVLLGVLLRRYVAFTAPRVASGRAPLWATFEDMLRAWSQPLQELGVRQEATARRIRVQSITWAELPLVIRNAVLDTFTGRVPLWGAGTGAVDAAAPHFDQGPPGYPAGWRLIPSPAASWVWSTPAGRAIAEPRVDGGGGSLSPLALVCAGALLLVLFLVGVI